MEYTVLLKPSVVREMKKLPQDIKIRIAERIDRLEKEPRPADCLKMQGDNLYRIRVGDYRIIYQVQDTVLVVLVVKVGNRRDAYRKF